MISGMLGYAQQSISLESYEARLDKLFKQIPRAENDTEKETLCDAISVVLDTVLLQPSSFQYPFDSLRTLGKVFSPDNKLRFYTWNLPYLDGTNRFYGMLQYHPDQNTDPQVFALTDSGADSDDILHAVLDGGNWSGSLVYEIAQVESMDTTFYVLLGYAPYSLFISERTIDILYFKPEAAHDSNRLQPVFGKPVFHIGDSPQCRVVFKYSARAQMMLQWNASAQMIVFDHLSPLNPSYTGNFQFYGPDFSYDGFVYDGRFWRLMEDVDIRNIQD